MFYRARRALNRAWFDFHVRSLTQTPPLPSSNSPVTVASMVCHGEVLMYLLALKSFVAELGFSPRVVVLNDGSLGSDDVQLLRTQVPSISIRSISEFDTGKCPKRGCWERLMLICDLVQDGYVVQLDSDTLTSKPITEVLTCIRENRSFTLLGDRSTPRVQPMLEAWEDLKGSKSSQPQAVCERNFNLLPEATSLRYLRGNAGFVGYAHRSISRERVEWFSELMRGIAEGTWDQWGSEQLTSNLLISNSEDPVALPFPRYCSYWAHPDINYADSAFVHFIGPHRYSNGFYKKSAKVALRALRSV